MAAIYPTIGIILATWGGVGFNSIEYRTIVLSGTHAPGTAPGVVFDTLYNTPIINKKRRASFRGDLSGPGVNDTNNTGIWAEEPALIGTDSLRLIAREGDPAPGTAPGVVFGFLGIHFVNSAGQVALSAELTGPGVNPDNNSGIWRGTSNGLTLLVRTGEHAPGTPTGVRFAEFFSLLFNEAGQVVFLGGLQGPGVNVMNARGIWASQPDGSIALIAWAGSQAPGLAPGVLFTIALDPWGFNDLGQTVITALLTGTGVTPETAASMWVGGPGTLQLLARAGMPAPGTDPGETFGYFADDQLTIDINNAGQCAFVLQINPQIISVPNRGIWTGRPGQLRLVARSGDPAPGTETGVRFDWLAEPIINPSGRIAFYAGLTGPGVDASNDLGIWRYDHGTLELFVRDGSHAPGTAAGVKLVDAFSPALTPAGRSAVKGGLTGPGVRPFVNDIGIWAEDPQGTLTMVARIGDLVRVGPGDFRFLTFLDNFYTRTGGEDGREASFVDCSQLGLRFIFADDSVGLIMAGFPPVSGDVDDDCRTTLADYAVFRDCMAGPDAAPQPNRPDMTSAQCLAVFDFDDDADVDAADFAQLQDVFTGP